MTVAEDDSSVLFARLVKAEKELDFPGCNSARDEKRAGTLGGADTQFHETFVRIEIKA